MLWVLHFLNALESLFTVLIVLISSLAITASSKAEGVTPSKLKKFPVLKVGSTRTIMKLYS